MLVGRGGERDEARHDVRRAGGRGRGWRVGSGEAVVARTEATRQRNAVAEVREGMPGVDGERRDDGMERPPEVVLEEDALLARGLLGADDGDALGGEERLDLLEEAAMLLVDQLVDAAGDGGEGGGGGKPVRAGGGVAGAHADA